MDREPPSPAIRSAVLTVAVLLQYAVFASASAQTNDDGPLAQAKSLSEAGQFGAVVTLLEPYVKEHPTSARAWLLLAEHQYWSGVGAAASRTYKDAIQKHPADAPLRLSYARYLLDNGEADAAKAVLRPLGVHNADAEALRGTMAWWSGDLAEAARLFKSALKTNPDQAEAAAGLAAIRADARPWVRIVGARSGDSQPLARNGATVEAGFFFTPLQTLRGEVRHARYTTDDRLNPITTVSAEARSFWPTLNLETEVTAGIVSRTESTDWTGLLVTGFRLPYGLRLGGRLERAPYLYTVASVQQDVMTVDAQATLSLDRHGWLGEAAAGRTVFPDDNVSTVAYSWLMAPLYRADALTLQGGYSFSYQNTAEHRFTPVVTTQPRPGQPPEWEGRYVPYYTPLNIRSHSATGSLSIRAMNKVTVHVNGSYTFFGKEQSPFVYTVGRAPATGIYEHIIHPWNIRGSVSAELSPSLTMQVESSHMSSTWYDASTLNLSLYVRF